MKYVQLLIWRNYFFYAIFIKGFRKKFSRAKGFATTTARIRSRISRNARFSPRREGYFGGCA